MPPQTPRKNAASVATSIITPFINPRQKPQSTGIMISKSKKFMGEK
jgi:hypothetical protein